MTCREKLKQDHPEWTEEKLERETTIHCPSFYGLPNPDPCRDVECSECWNLEIPEEKPTYIPFDDAMAMVKNVVEPTIKDSGDRTQFESGAVRDMREGKGRCDLMPLEVVSLLLPAINEEDLITEPDNVLKDIASFKQTNRTRWLYSALWAFANYAYNKSSSTMMLEVSKHYEEGAKKYGENNWQKGIPTWCYIDSAIRHYLKWLRGDKDEPHDRAFVWNIMCCIWEVDYREKNKEE